MQINCPQCQVLLEIPDHLIASDVLSIECGACQRRFRLQLNRPSLKVRRPVNTAELRVGEGERGGDGPVILTVSSVIEGRQILAHLGQVTSEIRLANTPEERDAGMLDALNRAQEALRDQARALGADGVVEIQSESADLPENPVLRLTGTAVRLIPQ